MPWLPCILPALPRARSRPLGRGQAAAALAAALAVAVGCGSERGLGAQAAVKPGPATATADVTVRVATWRPVDKLLVEARAPRVQVSIPWVGPQKTYATTLTVDAKRQVLTATATSSKAPIARAELEVPFVRDAHAAVFLQAIDTTGGWPIPGTDVAISGLMISPTETRAGDEVELAAVAIASPATVPVAYRWSSECAGAFEDASAARTTWTPAAAGTCVISAHASTPAGRDTRSGTVLVRATSGTVDVVGEYVPWPTVSQIELSASAGTCAIARDAPDASCRIRVPPSEATTLSATVAGDAGAVLGWSDDCGGTFTPPTLPASADVVTAAWTAPAAVAPVVCLLRAQLELEGMVDVFAVAVLVAQQ